VQRRPPIYDANGAGFADVLARAQRGEGAAWEELYRWLAPTVAGYLRLQGAPDVDDLTSEVFLGLVRSISSFRGDAAQFRSFVFVIAHRRLQDGWRRDVRGVSGRSDTPLPVDHPMAGGDVTDDALHRLAGERVLALCDTLPPDQRDVVLLRVVADLSLEQAAAVVGKTVGAVKALQRRGFENIRRTISQEAVSL
jgi:RNA polymerase sigma factor (sigma-70 family)